MSKVAVEHFFNTPTTRVYDSTKTFLGSLCVQVTGATLHDCFAGPASIQIARPGEAPISITAGFPHVISEPGGRSNIAWVFLISCAAAATTRPILLYEHNYLANTLTSIGRITPTVSTAGNMTVRGFRMTYDTFTTGTVSGASGSTTISGVDTLFTTDRIAVGARIGFGSTSPAAISTWYPISAIASNTSLTIGTPLLTTIAASSVYVIEELRAIIAATNATAVSGGLRVVKGINYDDFGLATAIPMAAATDNIKGCYWLADALVSLNSIALGMGLQPKTSNTEHNCYVFDNTTNTRIFKYNIRASLASLSLGRSLSSFVLATSGPLNTGTASQVNNGRYGSVGAYLDQLWYTTTTRVYAISATSLVASALFSRLEMSEVPPGGAASFAVTNTMNSVEIAGSIDRLVVLTTLKGYVTPFNTIGSQFENTFLPETRQYDSGSSDVDSPPTIQTAISTTNSLYVESGWGYFSRATTTTTNNQLYTFPLAAHWTYQSSAYDVGRIITPSLSTPNCEKFYRVYTTHGSYGADEFVKQGEGYRVYYRTSGINDNSGSWSLLDEVGNLQGVDGATSIQFMLEFMTIGDTCLPAKINSIAVLYETSEYLPSHLEWNFSDTSSASGIIGFSQVAAYGSVPNLLINYYRSDNDANVLSQSSTGTTNGAFEYYTGAVWASGLGTDTIGIRRRFVPTAGLPSNTNVYTKISIV